MAIPLESAIDQHQGAHRAIAVRSLCGLRGQDWAGGQFVVYVVVTSISNPWGDFNGCGH